MSLECEGARVPYRDSSSSPFCEHQYCPFCPSNTFYPHTKRAANAFLRAEPRNNLHRAKMHFLGGAHKWVSASWNETYVSSVHCKTATQLWKLKGFLCSLVTREPHCKHSGFDLIGLKHSGSTSEQSKDLGDGQTWDDVHNRGNRDNKLGSNCLKSGIGTTSWAQIANQGGSSWVRVTWEGPSQKGKLNWGRRKIHVFFSEQQEAEWLLSSWLINDHA